MISASRRNGWVKGGVLFLRAGFFCLSLKLHSTHDSLTNVLQIFRIAQRWFTCSHLNHSDHLELFKNLCDHGTCSFIDFGSGSYFWFWWMDMKVQSVMRFFFISVCHAFWLSYSVKITIWIACYDQDQLYARISFPISSFEWFKKNLLFWNPC